MEWKRNFHPISLPFSSPLVALLFFSLGSVTHLCGWVAVRPTHLFQVRSWNTGSSLIGSTTWRGLCRSVRPSVRASVCPSVVPFFSARAPCGGGSFGVVFLCVLEHEKKNQTNKQHQTKPNQTKVTFCFGNHFFFCFCVCVCKANPKTKKPKNEKKRKTKRKPRKRPT